MKKETFQELKDQTFTITFAKDYVYDFKLCRIIEGQEIKDLGLEPFTLEFQGALDNMIFNQGIYKVHHDKLGEMELFLIPRKPDKEGVFYHCILS